MAKGTSSSAPGNRRALTGPRLFPILAALSIAAAVTGCSPDEPKDLTGLTVDDRARGQGQPDALMAGQLVEIDGCVYLDDALGARWIISFPRGSVERTPTGIRVKGTDHEFGDDFSVTGQTFPTRDGSTAPTSCETENVWMAFP
ncbi:hypothetical protein [Sanguibacter sp. HDW7]|uniref:hypothetical protein n=1 Tax=Sanguibacter sp. HDW7 TaxID=2714931 RepID=UPI00140CC1FB|nr:hypothetical protein [Sanguibacter sp. HDW7]QIK82661.1 hypothetical protein G7063_02775 [Sanguibacter sp. HDW7]